VDVAVTAATETAVTTKTITRIISMVEIDVSEGSGDDIGCCEDKGVGGEALSDVRARGL